MPMDARVGGGWRQQAILRLMADGKPRTNASIAEKVGLSTQGAATTVGQMRKRDWLRDSGTRGYYRARMWVITDAGREMAPGSSGT